MATSEMARDPGLLHNSVKPDSSSPQLPRMLSGGPGCYMCPTKLDTPLHHSHFCYIFVLIYGLHPNVNLNLSGLEGTLGKKKNLVLTYQEKHLASDLTSPCLSFPIRKMWMIKILHWAVRKNE